jgi:HK97 family phage major capsid protein
MADGGTRVEIPTEIRTPDDGLRAIKAVAQFCRDHREKIEKLDLTKIEADLADAQRAIHGQNGSTIARADVGGSQREMLDTYTIRADELAASGARTYTAHTGKTGTAVTEEVGGIRLFGRAWVQDDSEGGVETDYLPGLIDDPNPVTERQAELQKAWSQRVFIQGLQRTLRPGNLPSTPKLDRKIRRLIGAMGIEKAFADASGVGAEWIPDDMIPMVETYVRHNRQVAALFTELPVGRDTSLLPYLSAGFTPYIHGEVNSDDFAQIRLSSLTTAQRTISVRTLAVRTQISDNAAEDALVPFMAQIMDAGGFALLSGEEDAIINGDTTASHQDTGIATWNPDNFYGAAPGGLSIDHRRICQGLRKRASEASNTTDRATFTFATFMADAGSLAGPKQGPGDAVAIVNNYILATKILVLDQVATLEKYGSGAAVLTGEVARLGGRPVIPSQFLTADMNASGIYDATTMTKAGVLQVLRSRFVRPVRRGVTVEFQRDATRGVTNVIWKMRGLPIKQIGAASEKNAHFAYNMA